MVVCPMELSAVTMDIIVLLDTSAKDQAQQASVALTAE